MGGSTAAGIPADRRRSPPFATENKSSGMVEIIGKLGEVFIGFGMRELGCGEADGGVDRGKRRGCQVSPLCGGKLELTLERVDRRS
jgi:hypothetical protein